MLERVGIFFLDYLSSMNRSLSNFKDGILNKKKKIL